MRSMGGSSPQPLDDNVILNVTGGISATEYSDAIRIDDNTILALSVDFTLDSLTQVAISMQAWSGEAWQLFYYGDAVTPWGFSKTGDFDGVVLIGNSNAASRQNPGEVPMTLIRFRVVPTGTAGSSSIKLRLFRK